AARGRRALVRGGRAGARHTGGDREEPPGPRARRAAAAVGGPAWKGAAMSCTHTRESLSLRRDGGLDAAGARALAAHLDACAPCAAHERAYTSALDALGELPRLHPEETIASAVLHRLDVESRGP